ncbi:MAG: MFS transporter [Candidatus Gracilibacteria bacterium]
MNKDILKYYVYSALSSFLFFLPVVYIFFKDSGLSFTQIFITETIFSIGVVLFEVPTGALADYIGRKKSILIGALLWILSCFVFFIGSDFFAFAIGQLICAMAVAFISGADTALFYEILHRQNKEKDFKKYQGTAQLISLASISFASLMGGFIASVNMKLTFVLSAVAFAILFFVVASIKSKETAKGDERPHYLKVITESFSIIKSSKWILWIFLFSGIVGATFKTIYPLTQVYMQTSELDIKYFGLASAYFFLVAAIASKIANGFELFFKKWSYFVLSLLLIIPIFVVSSVVFKAGFLIFGLVFFVSSISSVITNHEILKATPESKHATVLSFNNLLYHSIFAVSSPFFGYYLGVLGFNDALFIFGLILTAIFFVIFVSYLIVILKKFQSMTPLG